MPSLQTKNNHLLWRAGFGPAASQLTQLSKSSPLQWYKALQKAAAKEPDYIDVADDYLKGLVMGMSEAGRAQKQELGEVDRKLVRQKQRDSIKSLNLQWLGQMVNSPAQLREKMAFFWHGHFATRNLNIFYQQQLLHIIRTNALGSFRTLLHEVSKSAAMLNFLNAQQNKKGHPNENFAREVMELFTLGRGHYSEDDIKEAARAFTGWGANLKGEFAFRRFQHDEGSKTVLGKTGNFTGEEVLDILLDQPQTARYITQKIYRFLVNQTLDEEKVSGLSNRFYKSDYNISALLEDIFTSDWFYDEKNMGAQIKSPIELIAGIQRALPMQLQNEEALLLLQRILGQLLFYPPNVAGWPGGKNWIDSSTLMVRLRLPQLMNEEDELNIRPKTDDDQNGGRSDEELQQITTRPKKDFIKMGKPLQAHIDWDSYTKGFEKITREELLSVLQTTLLQVKPTFSEALIKSYADSSSRESFIKTATLQLMSTPEYQMC